MDETRLVTCVQCDLIEHLMDVYDDWMICVEEKMVSLEGEMWVLSLEETLDVFDLEEGVASL